MSCRRSLSRASLLEKIITRMRWANRYERRVHISWDDCTKVCNNFKRTASSLGNFLLHDTKC